MLLARIIVVVVVKVTAAVVVIVVVVESVRVGVIVVAVGLVQF